jgi:hypothetical protein
MDYYWEYNSVSHIYKKNCIAENVFNKDVILKSIFFFKKIIILKSKFLKNKLFFDVW